MIVVDTSSLMAILHDERPGPAFEAVLRDSASRCVIAAPTRVEAFVAAERRFSEPGGGRRMASLCDAFGIETRPFDAEQMALAQDGFDRFGKGRGQEPAALNLGDCFSYALAKSLNAPLLFVGEDFAKTDVLIAEAPSP